MKKNILFLAALGSLAIVTPSSASATEAVELQVSRLGDIHLDCGKLSKEAFLMREIITTTEDIKDDSELRTHGINAAAGIGSFLIGSATGGIGLAAAGFLINQSNEDDADTADTVQSIAAQRRGFMVGIFNAKGCYGPIEHVMLDGMDYPTNTIVNIASVEPAAGGNKDEAANAPSEREKPLYNN